MAEADCDHPRGVTSSSSQRQQTSGDDPLLCPLQQHGTSCNQTSGIWILSNPDSRLICLTVTDMTKHHCISRYIDNSRPCNGCGVPCYGALEIICRFIIFIFLFKKFTLVVVIIIIVIIILVKADMYLHAFSVLRPPLLPF